MEKTIPHSYAIELARLHSDVMTIDREQSDICLIGGVQSARQVYDRYIFLCDKFGVRMFNEHWQASFERTLDGIEARQRAVWKKISKQVAA
jgi:hypothetical protein